MQAKFQCPTCSNLFEAEGSRFEYHSPIYGPCAKYVSESPCCLEQSDEYREPNPAKKASAFEPPPAPSCCGGGGCGF